MTVRDVRPPTPDDLDRAWRAVSAELDPTPLVPSGLAPGALLKLETFQPTGAFKVRGALAAVAALPEGRPAVTASAGNHGLGMAYAAAKTGADITVVVSTRASQVKVDRMGAFPVRIVQHGTTYDEAEAHAMTLPGHFVSPYNDPAVIAGQGTIGSELDRQAEGPLTVIAPVGGGGLLAGLCLWARARGDVRVVGVESAVSRGVSASVAAGRVVEVEVGESFADGLLGNLEPGCVTPEVIGRTAELTSVTDDQIRTALRRLFHEHGLVAEGSGAAGVAALLAGKVEVTGRPVVIVSGRNITVPTFTDAIHEN
ncbi:pyridoxal-phosphate dependent enzyme [Actinomadura darangshiensis]|uniref:Pyridoxal-phosphate dependent enzyme n=1 Tax=Actinomadura darangshiensis TaxID=705336 RepID=A0A4R5ANM4_9ACTN|nr:pyridoxal-phosphate dependent enzyme [Actinomadura darangshiensis]TDD73239.1 pyridoxal-phosphate dependent enzyme [Actinomadura darangshiensis]